MGFGSLNWGRCCTSGGGFDYFQLTANKGSESIPIILEHADDSYMVTWQYLLSSQEANSLGEISQLSSTHSLA